MLHKRHMCQALQDFGQAAFHACALASGHDDHIHRMFIVRDVRCGLGWLK
jgi:hypothetical protein